MANAWPRSRPNDGRASRHRDLLDSATPTSSAPSVFAGALPGPDIDADVAFDPARRGLRCHSRRHRARDLGDCNGLIWRAQAVRSSVGMSVANGIEPLCSLWAKWTGSDSTHAASNPGNYRSSHHCRTSLDLLSCASPLIWPPPSSSSAPRSSLPALSWRSPDL
jgi:hypothetical protein